MKRVATGVDEEAMAVALILLTLSLLVLTFEAVHRACVRIGERLVLAGCRRPCPAPTPSSSPPPPTCAGSPARR